MDRGARAWCTRHMPYAWLLTVIGDWEDTSLGTGAWSSPSISDMDTTIASLQQPSHHGCP